MSRANKACFLLVILMGLYSLLRWGFFFNNQDYFREFEGSQIFWTFLQGLRFDLSAVLFTNGLLILLFLAPFEKVAASKIWRYTLGWMVILANSCFLTINVFDFEYYQFRGKRLTKSSFEIAADLKAQILPSMMDYWHFWALTFTLIAILMVAVKRTIWAEAPPSRPINRFLAFLGFLIFLPLGIRGGWQAKPLILANAFQGPNPKLAHLTLNSTFTLIRSSKASTLQKVAFYKDWPSVKATLTQPEPAGQKQKHQPNFVIIILESFSKEYVDRGFAPFLTKLGLEGTSFQNSFANGRRSIEALMSIFAGIPNLMDDPLITSLYQTNRITGLPTILKKHDYSSAFFHGGNNGTMFFDTQAKILGFDHYYGADNYPHEGHGDDHWGIFDEPFLQYSLKKMDQLKPPFLAGVFTLSSHYPYKIPKVHKDKFPKGTLPIHESIGYADHALKEFFKVAATKEWFENTIFILTGDHTSESEDPSFQDLLGLFRVPIIWWSPKRDVVLDRNLMTQHIDIMPSILHLLGPHDDPRARFGAPVQRERPMPHVLLYSGATYYAAGREYLIRASLNQEFQLFNWREDPHFKRPLGPPREEDQAHFKAQIQYHNNGLIEDKLNW